MKNAMNFRPVGLMLLFCLIPLWAFAQSVMVKGVVKDTSGEAIIGASVLEKRSEEHTSELQSRPHLVCRLLLEKKKLTISRTSNGQHKLKCQHPMRT